MNRVYRMNQAEYQGLLQVASEQVPFGIYGIEKQGYAELRCDRCRSMSQLKELTRQFRGQGYKVYANRTGNLKDAGGEGAEGALKSATG